MQKEEEWAANLPYWGVYSGPMYHPRNELLADLLVQHKPTRIFEFCGAEGDLAETILKKIGGSVKTYYWCDWWHFAVQRTKERLSIFPQMFIEEMDVDTDWEFFPFEQYDCFVCTALEHVAHDLEILESLKPGTLVALSLPNSPAEDHFRSFPTMEDINQRYGHVLRYLAYDTFMLTNWRTRAVIKTKNALRSTKLLKILQKASGYRHFMRPDLSAQMVHLLVARKYGKWRA